MVCYYRTKLKLDKEVGGVDFSELCTVTYLITYPYGWTVNFEIWNLRFKHRGTKNGRLLTTHQPPIAKASQTWARPIKYRYDQAELDKEVGKRDFLFDIITYPYAGTINFKICFDVNQERIPKFEWLTNSLTQSGRFRTSGSIFGSRSTGCRLGSFSEATLPTSSMHEFTEPLFL